MGFIIAGIIILLLLLITLLWVKLSLVYNSDGAKVTVKILFFRYMILGKEKKKPKKGDFKIRKFRKRRKKVLNKYQKRTKKTRKKSDVKESSEQKKVKKRSPKELITKILDIFGVFLKRFPKYLRVDCARLLIGVGGKDAAETAVNYGVTVQSVQYVGTLLNSITNFEATKDAKISVYPDFISEKWTAEINIIMRLRVIHILKLGIILLKGYLGYKLNGKKQVKVASSDEKKAA